MGSFNPSQTTAPARVVVCSTDDAKQSVSRNSRLACECPGRVVTARLGFLVNAHFTRGFGFKVEFDWPAFGDGCRFAAAVRFGDGSIGFGDGSRGFDSTLGWIGFSFDQVGSSVKLISMLARSPPLSRSSRLSISARTWQVCVSLSTSLLMNTIRPSKTSRSISSSTPGMSAPKVTIAPDRTRSP